MGFRNLQKKFKKFLSHLVYPMKNLFVPCPYCWIYTSFSKTLYLACADDDSRRKSDLIPFVYTATTTIYSNATLKARTFVVFVVPSYGNSHLLLCKLSTNHKPAVQFDFKVFFVTEVCHSWALADSNCISEVRPKLPKCAMHRYFMQNE